MADAHNTNPIKTAETNRLRFIRAELYDFHWRVDSERELDPWLLVPDKSSPSTSSFRLRLSSKCPNSLHPDFFGPRLWIETDPRLGRPATLSDGLEAEVCPAVRQPCPTTGQDQAMQLNFNVCFQ